MTDDRENDRGFEEGSRRTRGTEMGGRFGEAHGKRERQNQE